MKKLLRVLVAGAVLLATCAFSNGVEATLFEDIKMAQKHARCAGYLSMTSLNAVKKYHLRNTTILEPSLVENIYSEAKGYVDGVVSITGDSIEYASTKLHLNHCTHLKEVS